VQVAQMDRGVPAVMARDKFALHFSKAAWSSGVHVMGWEPLTFNPEMMREIVPDVMPRGVEIACSS
jgi:hypothetical protein